MRVYAISDPHLSGAVNKPMDIFGGQWENYWENIKDDWNRRVGDQDIVLIPGDISWAMRLEDAKTDLLEIASLKGRKVIIRGNHDYWWSSYSKVKAALPNGVYAVQNDALKLENAVIAGTRGWTIPDKSAEDSDIKIYLREKERLKLSLNHAARLKTPGDRLYVMIHYPPFDAKASDSEFTKILESYPVDCVVYGHLHGKDCRANYLVEKNSIKYYLASCDLVGNKLVAL